MKMMLQRLFFGSAFLLCGVLFSTSCINEEYDLEKEIDMEMTFFKGMAIPVGDIQKIRISEILSIDETSSLIVADENGDYKLAFSGDDVSASVDIPELKLAGSEGYIQTEPVTVHFPLSGFSGLSGNLGDHKLVYSELTGKKINTEMDIEIDTEIPSEIIDIKSVDLDAVLTFAFTANVGKIHVPSGFRLEFPSDVHLKKYNETSDYSIEGGNVVVINRDVTALSQAGSPFEMKLIIDKINVPAGSVGNGRLVLDEHVKLSGDLYVKTSDFKTVPDELMIDMTALISGLDVRSASVKLDIDESVEGAEWTMGEVPDFLAGNDIALDLYNPAIRIKGTNTSPLSFAVLAEIASYQDNAKKKITLGNDPEIVFGAGGDTEYLMTRRQASVPSGVTNIVIPEMADLMKSVPDKFAIEAIKISSESSEYITIVSGDSYTVGLDYEISAPLAFGEDMKLAYTQDITDLGLEFDGNLADAVLSLDIVNSIPLSFNLKAIGLDAAGNPVSGLTLALDKALASGTHNSPVATTVKIDLNNNTGKFTLDGLRLTLEATAPSAEHIGSAINAEQGLELKNIVLSVPEGITVNLNPEN